MVGGPNDDAARQPLTVKHASAAETAGLDVATQRFAAAGLTLPPLIVAFSDDPADCYGHLGIFDAATTPWTITVCSDLAFVPTHELAHAWLDANMDMQRAAGISAFDASSVGTTSGTNGQTVGSRTPPSSSSRT